MNTLEAVQNALQAAQTARDGGDIETALIEAHIAIEAAEAYALQLSCEFIAVRKRARAGYTELSTL